MRRRRRRAGNRQEASPVLVLARPTRPGGRWQAWNEQSSARPRSLDALLAVVRRWGTGFRSRNLP